MPECDWKLNNKQTKDSVHITLTPPIVVWWTKMEFKRLPDREGMAHINYPSKHPSKLVEVSHFDLCQHTRSTHFYLLYLKVGRYKNPFGLLCTAAAYVVSLCNETAQWHLFERESSVFENHMKKDMPFRPVKKMWRTFDTTVNIEKVWYSALILTLFEKLKAVSSPFVPKQIACCYN